MPTNINIIGKIVILVDLLILFNLIKYAKKGIYHLIFLYWGNGPDNLEFYKYFHSSNVFLKKLFKIHVKLNLNSDNNE